jgi:hypothetical protein
VPGWELVKKSDPVAVEIANRHYSRQAFGKQGVMLGPPGRLRCFRISDYAVWVSHWPYAELALDGLDAYRCTMFRNEGPDLGSDLVLEAMLLTEQIWGPAPRWITWVAPGLVRSENPGCCFKKAGWRRDREWVGGRKGIQLIRLSSEAVT